MLNMWRLKVGEEQSNAMLTIWVVPKGLPPCPIELFYAAATRSIGQAMISVVPWERREAQAGYDDGVQED